MAEDALKIRRSAKTRFTRKKNEFFKAIAEKKGTEILKRKFDELTDAWSTVEGKHDIYLTYLTEEEITANQKWIEELQEEYNEASTVYIKYDNERKALELKEQEELNRQHIIKLREEEFQRIVQQTIMKKKSTEAIFESLIEHVKNITESKVKVMNDHRSKFSSLSNWKEEAWKKKSGLQRDSNPWPPRRRCVAQIWRAKTQWWLCAKLKRI